MEQTERTELSRLAGEVFELAECIDYQEGAIVSRTLVDGDNATITLFALAEEQSISEHSAPHEALLQVLDGTASVQVDEDAHTLAAGESIVFPADVPHALDAPERFKMLLTMVR